MSRRTVRGPEPKDMRSRLERHAAFWRCGPAARPLQGASRGRPLAPAPSDESYELTPERVWDGLADGLDRLEAQLVDQGVLDGDLFRCLTIPGGPPWMPAILGCPMRVFPSSHTHWREPLPGGWDQLQSIDLDTGRAWRQVLVEGTRRLVQRFGGRYPISTLHFRGPVDMLAHALGDTEMCLRLADDPEGVRSALARMTSLWIDVARGVISIVPTYEGGYIHRYGLWAPGSVVGLAVDASNLLSPAQYCETFLPFDLEIASAFDHALIHTHSASAQHHEAWLTIPRLAVHIADDPAARISWPRLLAACRHIQEAGHPLILLAQQDHYREALGGLAPAGLMLRGYNPY